MASGHQPEWTAALRPCKGRAGGRAPVCRCPLSPATKAARSGAGGSHRMRCNTHDMSVRPLRTKAAFAMMLAFCLAGCATNAHSKHPHDLCSGPAQKRGPADDGVPDAVHPCASDDGGAAVASVRGVRPAYLPDGSRGQRRSLPVPARLPQQFRLDVHVVRVPGGVLPRRPRPSDRPRSPGGPGRGPPTGAARARREKGYAGLSVTDPGIPPCAGPGNVVQIRRLTPGQLWACTGDSPGRDAGVHLAQHHKLCGEHRWTDHSRARARANA